MPEENVIEEEKKVRFYKQVRIIQETIGDIPMDGEMEINGQIIKYPTKNNVVGIIKRMLKLTDLNVMPVKLITHRIDSKITKDRYGGEHLDGLVILEEIFKVVDTVTGYSETYSWLGESRYNDKGVTIASSFAIRDFYMHFFNITVDGDASYEDAELIRQATDKMTKEGLTEVFYNKALHFVNKATMVKVKKEANRKGIKLDTWNMQEMEIEDLLTILDLSLSILNPDKAKADLKKAAEEGIKK